MSSLTLDTDDEASFPLIDPLSVGGQTETTNEGTSQTAVEAKNMSFCPGELCPKHDPDQQRTESKKRADAKPKGRRGKPRTEYDEYCKEQKKKIQEIDEKEKLGETLD